MSKLNLVRLTFLFVAASVNGFAADLATEQLWKDVLSGSRVSIPADPGGRVTRYPSRSAAPVVVKPRRAYGASRSLCLASG